MSQKTKKKSRTSFGATAPPFIDYLKDILHRYPDGGQILKELIQNADDAEATDVVFIHDERRYGTKSLWTQELGQYQGPALYVYNNASFTEEDWEGIQLAGRSFKRNDPNKVGRFGIGFNSVYHITDLPCILSGSHLGFMDPQEQIFGEREGGFRWYMDDPEHQEALTTMRDQFQPFRDAVSLLSGENWSSIVADRQYFNGTIFRFPLRNTASKISDNLYDSEKVIDLFESFIADAELSLLFLKNVASVSLKHVRADGKVTTQLQVRSLAQGDALLEAKPGFEASTRFKVITQNSRETKWLLTTCAMKKGGAANLDLLAAKLSFSPQVDLAFPCGGKRDSSQSRLSCFLPLPDNDSNKTGLPVYVNASFGLTDNRRQIKWQEPDQKHDEHAVWNESLIKEVLPQAYLILIKGAISLAQRLELPASCVYDLWPDLTQMKQGDKWYAVALDVLQHLFRENTAVLSLARDETKFIPPSEALLPCNGPTSPAILATLQRTLVSCGQNLVTLPQSVSRAIAEAHPGPNTLKQVTPAFIRSILRGMDMQTLSKDDKLCLLEYTLSDRKYKELEGLQLLPLNDGSFRTFTGGADGRALIDSCEFPRDLLPCCKNLFIPVNISPDCRDHLREMAGKSLFGIINVTALHVAEYTRRYLPEDWKETGPVTWNVRASNHPPSNWLQGFWKFLNTHFKTLSIFIGMPLIPVSPMSASHTRSLSRLQENTTLIFHKSKENKLPDHVAQLVGKVGGTVVKSIEWLRHRDLHSYVLCPSPKSVLKVLMNLNYEDMIRKLSTASHQEKEKLKWYLSYLEPVSKTEKEFLLQLPLFQTMKGLHVHAQSKQALLLTCDLKVPTEFPFPDSVVQCATEGDRRLLLLLGVKLLDTAEAASLLVDCIKKQDFRHQDTERVMAWILQHGDVLFSQNQDLNFKCKKLKFIQVKGGAREASSFFDPTNKTFQDIFEPEFFPPKSYTETPQMLKSLTGLGLINKEVDVTPEHLLRAATVIDQSVVDSSPDVMERACAFLKMIEKYDLLSKFSNSQISCLKMKKWIPCPQFSGNDVPQNNRIFCPDEVRHSKYKDVVGHVMPLLRMSSDEFGTKLGLKRPPPPEKVIDNLSFLMSQAETMADPDKNVDFKRQLRCIYEHMQNHMPHFEKIMAKENRWLWSHGRFVSPQDLVLEYPRNLDLSSYIGKVPKEYLSFKVLLQKFGLRTTLSDEEILGILKSVRQTVEERKPPLAKSSEIRVSVQILNWLWKEKKMVKDDIPVPVHREKGQYTFKPLSTVVFCDVRKNGLNELKYIQEGIYILHEEITKAAAEWLKIRFLSTHILDPQLVGIEQCGQSEPITTRIKNILKEYDEESDIFKELIQNAEDAGAEQCQFLVDFRAHKYTPEELIDPNMSLCQGPCLWAFNNETFKDDDWENIVRVGAASKENKVEKIGKFGLGFNTVYHVTDIPSILSGTSLLILDPNVTHLKTHIKHNSNPGIKLNLSQQKLFECFPGQFGPYDRIFDCDFTKQIPCSGTLIRLPFRTKEEACTSEISKSAYYKKDIVSFQECLSENSKVHLLFLRNISTLTLQRIPENASTPPRDDQKETILKVSKTTVTSVQIPDKPHLSKQRESEKRLMKLDGKCNDVIDYHTANIVKITSQQSIVREDQSWLLYSCFGTQQSVEMALQESKHARFSLPVGGVAVPLQVDVKTGKMKVIEKDLSGNVFCFLPLSIHTGLPVNINGTFAVTSNRKGLWESGVKWDWNQALLQDPVVTAYITALLVLKDMAQTERLEAYSYHTFWPHREKVSQHFRSLVDAFYFRICQPSSSLELFYDGELWCSMSSAVFLHETIEEDKDIGALAVVVCKKHVKAPNRVVPLPQWLRNSLRQAGLENVLQTRTWNWETFYRQAVFNNLGAIDAKTRDALVLHAIDLNIKEINDLLVSHPCIPTKAGQLQYIRKLVNPSGKVACLFELEEERLLGVTNSEFCSPERIQRLMVLGMASDDLSLEDIAERAPTIAGIWSTDRPKAYRLLRTLLDLMRKQMNDFMSGEDSSHWERIKMTKFLPAFCPKDTSSVMLKRPKDIFNDKCSLLVNRTQPVLDHSNLNIHNNDPVLTFLGVNDSPSPEIVLRQLQESYEQSQFTDKSVLYKLAYECYKFLDQSLADPDTSSSIQEMAKSFPFILVDSTFVHIKCVAENEQFDAKPYLHVLPSNFGHFKRLWDCVGVGKSFTIHQFHTVLQELHSRYGSQPLSQRDLSICLTILNKGIYEVEKESVGDCLIPNEHGVLQHASEVVYNDSQWMPVPAGVTLCHNRIARAAALHFGIKTTRLDTLLTHEVKNIAPYAFEFGQREKLTVRIKNIISAYPSKKDILKELIQNADDAEATEIHFVWDKRQHDVEKTFGENWNQLQGPALCVFNDKVFSDADVKGIQQLGEGGKHSALGKIGKYGIGFNSVYHLTDCPSILTGDKLLCILDPNQKYIVSDLDKSPPGIGYKLDDTLKSTIEDVYKSFLPDQFPLGEGTMFRLPLRMGQMATSSKISNTEVTDYDMRKLCSALSEDSDGLILFLKNICKVQVHEISDQHPGVLKTIFAVEKSVSGPSREQKHAFVRFQQDALKSHTPVTPQKVIYKAKISTSDKKETNWIIAEQFGSHNNTSEQEITSAQLPQAAVAARMSIKLLQTSYFSESNFKFTGGAFCSLPLPGDTGLPVHINGNFEVDSARRGLWKEDGKSPKSAWNDFLKEDIIALLYADLLLYISTNIKNEMTTEPKSYLKGAYLYFWPIVSKDVSQEWHNMIHKVYQSIQERGLKVIPLLKSSTVVLGDQVVKEYSFDCCSINEEEPNKAPHLMLPGKGELNQILEDLGMRLVPFSLEMQKVWDSFKSAGVEVKEVTPTTVQKFVREARLNNPDQTDEDLPLPITDTLIRDKARCSVLLSFCLKEFEREEELKVENSSSFNGIPLLLTRDNVLRVFNSDSPKVISAYETLFLSYESQFADFSTNCYHIQVLQQFNLVKMLTVPEAPTYLRSVIQRLLQDCEIDPVSGLHVVNQKILEWLKVLWNFLTSEIKTETSDDEVKGLKMSDVRTLFSDFCILPVMCPRLNKTQLLTTLGNMSKVIHFLSVSDIKNILYGLGFMKLDKLHVDKHVSSFLRTELMNLNDKSAVLEQLCNINSSEFSRLSIDQLKDLQSFLQDGATKCKDKQSYQSKLKSLPIFLTVRDEQVRIDGPKDVFILRSTYLSRFPQLFILDDSKIILLQNIPVNLRLSEILKIKVLSDLEYFMKFILPHMHSLAEPQLLQCLKLVLLLQRDADYSKHKDAIISSLKTVQFIRSCHGTLEMASYYYDENVELYRTMLPQERFIPESFWAEFCHENPNQPRELLIELGMRHLVSADDIKQFAHQLESEASGDFKFETLKQKSSLLLKVALDFVINNADKMLLKKIANIKFIVPEPVQQELCDYHQPFSAERTTVEIRGSLIESDAAHQDLIWSSMAIMHVPVYMSADLKAMMRNVGAFEQPPPDCVTKNLRNICRVPCANDTLISTRARVLRSCYSYLQKNKFHGASLAGLPIVLVEKDKTLVKAEDVCISLQHFWEFRPYLYRISRCDAGFEDFFRAIGVNDNATAKQYCKVLTEIHENSDDKTQLHYNQSLTVRRTIEQLFQLLNKEQKSHFSDPEDRLYLLATDGKLYLSSTLYYNDTVFEVRRLEEALNNKFLLLEKLVHCHLGIDPYEHHRLLQLLPLSLRPKMLSGVTEEKILEADMQLCELGNDCEFSGWFHNHLSSQPLRYGLICLIRQQANGSITQEEAEGMCVKTFGSIQITCCKNLETALWLENEQLPATVRETDVFVKWEEEGCIFYLRHNDDMVPKVINDINMTLTKEMNALLGNKIASNHLPVLGQLLMCDSLDDVKKALAKNGIHDSAEAENHLLNEPTPGADIPEEWYDSLDMSFLNNFEEGEYVGYSTNNKYIYAIIVEVLGNSGPHSQCYKINIGQDEPIEVSYLDLYQFKRQKKPGRGKTFGSSAECSVLEPVSTAGTAPDSRPSVRSSPASLEEAKKEIDKCLEEIWPLPEEDRNKAIRRLYLRWHPDKNLDCYQLATEAFKYLKNRLDDLLKGRSRNAGSSHQGRYQDFTNCYSTWNQEARHHRQGRERFSRAHRSYNFWNYNQNVPQPNREEARRWCRQARCDLRAAHKDVNGGSTEWCLFKIHQAVEKALIAAAYKRHGQHPNNSSITALAAQVSLYSPQLRGVPQIVETLKKLGVDAKKTQYPDRHPFPNIPNEQFSPENEALALEEASELLRKVESYVS